MLFDIRTRRWDDELLDLLIFPARSSPRVGVERSLRRNRRELFGGSIKIAGMAGDQQAALFGQTCFAADSPRTPMAPAVSC